MGRDGRTYGIVRVKADSIWGEKRVSLYRTWEQYAETRRGHAQICVSRSWEETYVRTWTIRGKRELKEDEQAMKQQELEILKVNAEAL